MKAVVIIQVLFNTDDSQNLPSKIKATWPFACLFVDAFLKAHVYIFMHWL